MSELDRLVQISTRLAELNGRLRSELEASKRSSSELAALLENSRLGLEALRSELESSRQSSMRLSALAESSARESTALREALTRAEDSLRNSEASFEAFRKEAEARIRRERAGRICLGCVAAAGWALVAILLLL